MISFLIDIQNMFDMRRRGSKVKSRNPLVSFSLGKLGQIEDKETDREKHREIERKREKD